jgi:hypothetical protein
MVRSAAKRRVSNHEALPSCAIHRSRVYPRSDRFNAQVGHGRLAVTPRCARLLRMRAAHSLIHLSNSPSQRRARPACLGIAPRQASSPVFFVEAPGRPVFFGPLETGGPGESTPARCEGDGAPSDATLSSLVPALPRENAGAPLGAPPRQASRRSGLICGRFSLRRRAALFVDRRVARPCLRTGWPFWQPKPVKP